MNNLRRKPSVFASLVALACFLGRFGSFGEPEGGPVAAQGPLGSRGDALNFVLPEGVGDYRNPDRQHLAFFHA